MSALTPQLRELLTALATSMIPGGLGMPSAREADVGGRLLDAVLVARPDLEGPLVELLEPLAALGDPAEAERRLRANRAATELFALVAIGGYMMHPGVGSALSYPGQQPKPVNPFDINDVVDDGLLDPVIERGPIYREVPA
jgi:hypothetical protein